MPSPAMQHIQQLEHARALDSVQQILAHFPMNTIDTMFSGVPAEQRGAARDQMVQACCTQAVPDARLRDHVLNQVAARFEDLTSPASVHSAHLPDTGASANAGTSAIAEEGQGALSLVLFPPEHPAPASPAVPSSGKGSRGGGRGRGSGPGSRGGKAPRGGGGRGRAGSGGGVAISGVGEGAGLVASLGKRGGGAGGGGDGDGAEGGGDDGAVGGGRGGGVAPEGEVDMSERAVKQREKLAEKEPVKWLP